MAYEETNDRMNYVHFYNYFEEYANKNQKAVDGMMLRLCIEHIKEFLNQKDSGSLLKLMAEEKLQVTEDLKFYNTNPAANQDLPRILKRFDRVFDIFKSTKKIYARDFDVAKNDLKNFLGITSDSTQVDLV